MRSPATAALLLLVLAASPSAARADGLPVLGIDAGPSGVARGGIRYVTLGNGARSTMVAAVRREGGQVLRAAALRGAFTVPAVALDGSASGLSADGRTLVLIRPRAAFPQARTVLAILAVPELRVRRVLRLRGDFSLDAIAPDGRSLYLIQYVSRTDATRYVVRAYDLAARRLVRAPVVDPRERGEKMRGLPLTRAASSDGRWAYTLYDGGGVRPFIHALDTSTATARCNQGLPQARSAMTTRTTRPIAHRLEGASNTNITNSGQQQMVQYNPWCMPTRRWRSGPRQDAYVSSCDSGDRQWVKQSCFNDVS